MMEGNMSDGQCCAADRNKAVVRRLVEEVVNRGNTDHLNELVAADHVGHDPLGDHYGPEGMRIVVVEYRTAFPDLAVTIEDLFAEGDTVSWRFTLRGTHAGPFMGIPPTGREVAASGIAIDRLVDVGQIVESWCSLNALDLLRQVGATPMVRQPAEAARSGTISPVLGAISGSRQQ
jgi:steroid delta-isomerase-like uncharacterized protein